MIFTSEQVSAGHPDKICDQISDAILTECLYQDKASRVAVETLIKDWTIVVAGELTTAADIDVPAIARRVLTWIGLPEVERYEVVNLIGLQSPDIALGVDTGGAGDQGMMFGYATNETAELLPLPYVVATRALKILSSLRHPKLLADAKAQVSFDYDADRIHTFLISTQHAPDMTRAELVDVVTGVMVQAADEYQLNTDFKTLINPTGLFTIGSSFADSGVTGRKIIADTYGGAARHGGGAFSGKDPSKVDRSGAYIARKIARDIVRRGWADRCEVQIAYAIGEPEPVSVAVEAFATNTVPVAQIEAWVREWDLTPSGIIDALGLLNINYNLTSAYGHFGKSYLPWER